MPSLVRRWHFVGRRSPPARRHEVGDGLRGGGPVELDAERPALSAMCRSRCGSPRATGPGLLPSWREAWSTVGVAATGSSSLQRERGDDAGGEHEGGDDAARDDALAVRRARALACRSCHFSYRRRSYSRSLLVDTHTSSRRLAVRQVVRRPHCM